MAFDPGDIIRFWVDEVGEDNWYEGGDALDRKTRDRYGAVWQALMDTGGSGVSAHPRAELAALLVLDQFSRNMFRGTAMAFASDPLARRLARVSVAANRDLHVEGPVRRFFYMPFVHSEELADQDWGVALMAERYRDDEITLHARAHREIIARFGRFPFRNVAFGRASTADEQDFLDHGGYGAIVRQLKAE